METRFTDPKAEHLWRHAKIGLAFVGDDGKWLRVNPYLASVLGYTEAEMAEKTFQQITHPEDVEADAEMVRWVLEGRIENYTMTKRYLTKDMQVIWIRLTVTKIKDSNGEFGMFLSQIQPIHPKPEHTELVLKKPLTVDDVGQFIRVNWKLFVGAGAILGAATAKLLRWW